MLLQDKVIYITGGTSGIGEATVRIAAAAGARVFFVGRRQDQAQVIISDLIAQGIASDNLGFHQVDVSNAEQQEQGITACVQKFGQIDGVFANAGKHMVGNVVDTTLAQWQEMFRVDVEGVFLTLHYIIPHMQQRGGSIVLMGSDQCLVGKGSSSAYGAAKGAVGQLTKSTAIDFAKDNIRVNAVCPGTIDTPLARKAMKDFASSYFDGNYEQGVAFLAKAQPLQRLGTADEVANLVVFLLSDKAKFMTGSLVSIDGGYVAQ